MLAPWRSHNPLRITGKSFIVGQAFLSETVETGDENSDSFHYMQISLVKSMRFIYGDDWNDACKFGNDVIFPESRPLISV